MTDIFDTSALTPVQGATLPRNWEKAFGYEGSARWLSAYWTLGGDEAVYSDGLVASTAAFRAYQRLTKQLKGPITEALLSINACPREYARMAIYLLGSSDEPATYHLVLDLQERKIYVAPASRTSDFLEAQHPKNINLPASENQIIDADELYQWLTEAIDCAEPARTGSFTLCQECEDGWVLARDGGYDRCPNQCDSGIIWEEKYVPTTSTRKPARQI